MGADIRRYRKQLNLNQNEFSKRMGVSQTTLSLLEAGRISVTDDHIAALKENFAKARDGSFVDFLATIEGERGGLQSALHTPTGRYLTVVVWRWREGWDLSGAPPKDDADGLVTIPLTSKPVIAFAMTKQTEQWANGETLVFAGCERGDVRDGDLCLVQWSRKRGRTATTAIASAQHVTSGRGRVLQLTTISPSGTLLIAEQDEVLALLQVVYRARQT